MNLDGIPAFELEPSGNAATRWCSWVSRLENFLCAQGVADDGRKKAILLHCAGEATFERFQTLDKSNGQSNFQQAKDILSEHFNPRRNTVYEAYQFRQTRQEPGEGIDSFYAKLKARSKYCEFTDTDREIKAQLILMTVENKVRQKGLSEPDMSLETLLTFARTLEISEAQARDIVSVGPQSINKTVQYS